jgi:cytochrome P450
MHLSHDLSAYPKQTTAHIIAIALGLLALHPEEQEKVHEEVIGLSHNGNLPVSFIFAHLRLLSRY